WNSVFRRYWRWVETGALEVMLETRAELVEPDRSADMIDSTIVRAHHCAFGIKRGLRRPRRLADRVAASPPSSTPDMMRKADSEGVISAKSNRSDPIPHDKTMYKWRNPIEHLF